MQRKLGICQWFHYEDRGEVERAIHLMRDLGITHLRTGISWADYHRAGGRQWYDWQMSALAEFELLPCIWHTPPSLSEGGCCASPPRRLQDYADFLDVIMKDYGQHFDTIELWNEPNNLYKWQFKRFDPDWEKFACMIAMAGNWARQCGKRTVLGGMSPVDKDFIAKMKRYGALEHIDIVGIHGFPGMWFSGDINWEQKERWHGWQHKVSYIETHTEGRPTWVTETGLATWNMQTQRPDRFQMQKQMLEQAVHCPAQRLYWYSLIDLDPKRPAIEGFHVDENEYWMGLVTYEGRKKPAYQRMKQLVKTLQCDEQSQ